MKIDIKGFLLTVGYKITDHENGYGVAEKGMDSIEWNEDGNYIRIQKDAKTRTVFYGQIKFIQQLVVLFEIVR